MKISKTTKNILLVIAIVLLVIFLVKQFGESYRYNYSGTISIQPNRYFFITPGYGKNERKNMLLTSHGVWYNKKGAPIKYESVDPSTFGILKSLTNDQLKNSKYKKYLFYAIPNEDGGNSIFDFNGNCWFYMKYKDSYNYDRSQWNITAGTSETDTNFFPCPSLGNPYANVTRPVSYGSFVYTNDHKLSGPKYGGRALFYVHPYRGADVKNIRNGTDIVIYEGSDQDAGERIKVTINYTDAFKK
jgi:hypothetical protein